MLSLADGLSPQPNTEKEPAGLHTPVLSPPRLQYPRDRLVDAVVVFGVGEQGVTPVRLVPVRDSRSVQIDLQRGVQRRVGQPDPWEAALPF